MKRFFRGNKKGFTLIELLIVVGILGILAGVVTLGVSQFIGKGTDEARRTELHNVQTAVTALMATNQLAALGTGGGLDSTDNIIEGAPVPNDIGPFLVTALKYSYTVDGTGLVTILP